MRFLVGLALLLVATAAGLPNRAQGARLLREADSLTSGDHMDVDHGIGHTVGPDPYAMPIVVPPTYSSPGYYSPPPYYSSLPPYGSHTPTPGPYGPYTPAPAPSYAV